MIVERALPFDHQPTCTIIDYHQLLKTGSLDNAIREFSLAKPSWYMSHYTMIYKNGERMRDFLGLFVFIFYFLFVFILFFGH